MQLTFWFVHNIFEIVQLTEVSSNPCENNMRPRLILLVRSSFVLQATLLSYSLNRQACIRDQTGEQESRRAAVCARSRGNTLGKRVRVKRQNIYSVQEGKVSQEIQASPLRYGPKQLVGSRCRQVV